jgi:hypothetical protein
MRLAIDMLPGGAIAPWSCGHPGGDDVDDDLSPLSECDVEGPARRAVALLVVPLATGVARHLSSSCSRGTSSALPGGSFGLVNKRCCHVSRSSTFHPVVYTSRSHSPTQNCADRTQWGSGLRFSSFLRIFQAEFQVFPRLSVLDVEPENYYQ